jgi:hypothetical protein
MQDIIVTASAKLLGNFTEQSQPSLMIFAHLDFCGTPRFVTAFESRATLPCSEPVESNRYSNALFVYKRF